MHNKKNRFSGTSLRTQCDFTLVTISEHALTFDEHDKKGAMTMLPEHILQWNKEKAIAPNI